MLQSATCITTRFQFFFSSLFPFKTLELSTCTFPTVCYIAFVVYQQDEQVGSDMDRASSNPYRMSIEEYFNPPEEPNTSGRNVKMVYLSADSR